MMTGISGGCAPMRYAIPRQSSMAPSILVNLPIVIWFKYRMKLTPTRIMPTPTNQVPHEAILSGMSHMPPVSMRSDPQVRRCKRLFSVMLPPYYVFIALSFIAIYGIRG